VGALSFIKAGAHFESRSLIVGNPAKKIKEVGDEMITWKTEGTKLYQSLPHNMHNNWKACEPLREVPSHSAMQDAVYKTWNERKD